MDINDVVRVEYATGETFSGKVVNIRDMPPGDGHETERVLFTVQDMSVGYRSMYLHKCLACEIVGA